MPRLTLPLLKSRLRNAAAAASVFTPTAQGVTDIVPMRGRGGAPLVCGGAAGKCGGKVGRMVIQRHLAAGQGARRAEVCLAVDHGGRLRRWSYQVSSAPPWFRAG